MVMCTLLSLELASVSRCLAIEVLMMGPALRQSLGGRHAANPKVTTAVERSSISSLLKKHDDLGTPISEVFAPDLGFTLHRLLDFWEVLDPLMGSKAYLLHWDVGRIL